MEPNIYIEFLPALNLQYTLSVCRTKYRVFLCSCSASNLVGVLMDQQNVCSISDPFGFSFSSVIVKALFFTVQCLWKCPIKAFSAFDS